MFHDKLFDIDLFSIGKTFLMFVAHANLFLMNGPLEVIHNYLKQYNVSQYIQTVDL